MTKKESVIEQCIKGHWVPELKEDGDSLLRCSICNYPVSYFWGRTNFCPECGADLQFTGGCNSCPSCGYSKCN